MVGSEICSSHVGASTGAPLLDIEFGLYNVQKEQVAKALNTAMRQGLQADNILVGTAEASDARRYIPGSCVFHGTGESLVIRVHAETSISELRSS